MPLNPSTLRRALHRLGALAVLAWLGRGLVTELATTVKRQLLAPPRRQAPIVWRYGTPPLARLERFVERARPHLAAGEEIVFSSPRDGTTALGSGEFFRFLWASYYLGERPVIPAFDAAAGSRGTLWLAFGTSTPDQFLAEPPTEPWPELYRDPAGALFRRPPAPPAPGAAPP